MDTSETRISIVVDDTLPIRQAFELHQLLGIGVAEVRECFAARRPLLDEAVFGNNHLAVSRVLLGAADILADTQFSIHECVDEQAPSRENEIDLATLRQILAPQIPEPLRTRPIANLRAAQVIAEQRAQPCQNSARRIRRRSMSSVWQTPVLLRRLT